jgi:hypothetical protein
MPARLIVLLGLILAVGGAGSTPAAQVRSCAEVANDIAAVLTKRNVTRFTLTVVRTGGDRGRTIVGSCDGGARRIVYEPKGTGGIVLDELAAPAAPRPDPVAAASPKPSPEVRAPQAAITAPPPAEVTQPKTATAPPPVASGMVARAGDTMVVRPLDVSEAPRPKTRSELTRIRTLAVDQGADDRDTLEEFVSHLKISGVPELTADGVRADFVVIEVDNAIPPSVFTMITSTGTVLLAEKSARLMGLLPEQHFGLYDVCLLVRDFPAPGATYSEWTAEFNGTAYVKKTRSYRDKGCLDRLSFRFAR